VGELQVLGRHEGSPEQGEEGNAHGHRPDAERGAAEEAEVEHRLIDPVLPPHECRQQRDGQDQQANDHPAEPPALGRLDDRIDEDREAKRRERRSREVE
jgi:hypothetical protein